MTPNAEVMLHEARTDAVRLGELLEGYRNYLRMLARIQIGRRLQGKVDASDIVQEAFLDAHRYFPNFRGTDEGQLMKWLREILAGTLSNQVRRFFGTQARDPRMEVGIAADLDHSNAGLAHLLVDGGSSPSQQAARGEQSLQVAEALSRLPEDYQTVIVLRHLESLTFPEVAARMGKTVDSVEKLWLRAITKLKKAFGEGE